jgi:hypothetical protein
MTDVEIAALRRRRPGVRTSLAIEGLHLPPEIEALFEQFDRERLTMEEREVRLIEYSRARRAPGKVQAAE